MQKPVVLIEQDAGEFMSWNVLQKEVEKYGWQLFNLSSTRGFLPRTLPIVGALVQHGADDPLLKTLKEKKIPFVRIGNAPTFYYEKTKMSTVAIDIAKSGKVAAKYFSERGFNHLAYIGNYEMVNGRQLYENFSNAAEIYGCKVYLHKLKRAKNKDKNEIEEYLWDSAREITNWLAGLPKPVGLLTYSDKLASRYIAYCTDVGIKVPEDVAVLGIGNSSFTCETASVSISSIDLPWSRVWINSLRLLKKMINGKVRTPIYKFIAPSIVNERKSTESLVLENPVVKKSVQYIWENYSRNIGVEDIVNLTGVSRRTLQVNFKETLDRGINEEIIKKRLDVAQRLLLNTDMTVLEIAKKCGYNSANYFNKAFVKKHNCTAIEYRKKNIGKLNLD